MAENKDIKNDTKKLEDFKIDIRETIKNTVLSGYLDECYYVSPLNNNEAQTTIVELLGLSFDDIIPLDQKFFDKIGYEESKRYFEESYKFICEYKNLGEQNIISAVVHMDEDTPHMHLLFIPVIHTTDKQGNKIDKVCCRDFWKGKNSYRDLQNAYFKHISGKGFKLERGELVEVTNREHYSVQEYKRITNFENTKELLNSIKLELPETPDIKDFQKIMLNRDEKIKNKIIKPKDELIKKLYNENISLYKELSKQTTIIDKSEKFEKEKFKLETENRNLRFNLNMFQQEVEKTAKAIDVEYENKIKDLETKYKSKIDNLEYENSKLNKIIDKFKTNFKKFMKWICNKFSYPCEDDLIRDFNEETYSNIDFEQQLDVKQFEQDYEDEIDFDIY